MKGAGGFRGGGGSGRGRLVGVLEGRGRLQYVLGKTERREGRGGSWVFLVQQSSTDIGYGLKKSCVIAMAFHFVQWMQAASPDRAWQKTAAGTKRNPGKQASLHRYSKKGILSWHSRRWHFYSCPLVCYEQHPGPAIAEEGRARGDAMAQTYDPLAALWTTLTQLTQIALCAWN